jgi:site-specific DNA-methyltransferase (adenine-specific)
MPDKSVDAVITDPPYYKVADAGWDRRWKTREEFIDWLELASIQWRRILKDNGSLYVFADDKMAAYVQVMLDKRFLLLNHLVWNKARTSFAATYSKGFRMYAPTTERILFYSAQYDPTGWETVKLDMNNFVPLREYFRKYQEALGLTKREILEKIGQQADHCFRWGSSQWDMPTEETYDQLAKLPISNEFVRREYEDLRREYEDLRREYEDLRRPFNADENSLEVIEGAPVRGNENTAHPTTKPIWIMKEFVTRSTAEEMTVLDCFMGSGTTGVACVQTGRNFIGIEIDPDYYAIAERRIRDAQAHVPLPFEMTGGKR